MLQQQQRTASLGNLIMTTHLRTWCLGICLDRNENETLQTTFYSAYGYVDVLSGAVLHMRYQVY